MNTQRIVIGILLCSLMSVVACGGEEEETADTPAAAAPADDSADEPAEEPSGGGGGGVCGRARDCCAAYIEAMGANTPGLSAATACAGVQNANGPGADVGCQAAIDGWRQSLTAMSHDVPASCQ